MDGAAAAAYCGGMERQRLLVSNRDIAHALYLAGLITPAQYDVWLRQENGETINSMRRQYPKESGGFWSHETLYDWVRKVNEEITKSRIIAANPMLPQEPNEWGITVAQGHFCHEASNDTPQPHKKPRSKFPNADRLKSVGKRPRY